jgi:hypothetical protein
MYEIRFVIQLQLEQYPTKVGLICTLLSCVALFWFGPLLEKENAFPR